MEGSVLELSGYSEGSGSGLSLGNWVSARFSGLLVQHEYKVEVKGLCLDVRNIPWSYHVCIHTGFL